MKTRKCFNDSLQLSELGLGTASIGNLHKMITNQQAYQVISHAYDNGIRYFDTASEYGHGLAEHRLGNVLREFPRDTFIISTKVGDLLLPNKENYKTHSKFINHLPFNIRYDYTYDGIMRCLEDSLQRLGMNRVDIVYVHDLDPVVHDKELFQKYFKDFIESGYKALDQLRKSGVVKAIGLGIKSSKVCKDSLKYCDFQCSSYFRMFVIFFSCVFHIFGVHVLFIFLVKFVAYVFYSLPKPRFLGCPNRQSLQILCLDCWLLGWLDEWR